MIKDNDTLALVHESRDRLTEVQGLYVGAPGLDDLVALDLHFGGRHVLLSADAEDDTLVVGRDPKSSGGAGRQWTPLHQNDPWKEAVGKPLLWTWLMTNQQGYLDGVQFEFASSVEKASVVIQLIVCGGALKTRHVPEKFSDPRGA